MVVDIEQTKRYVLHLAKVLCLCNKKDFDSIWNKEKRYVPKFFSMNSMECSGMSRVEYMRSDMDEVELMVKALKTVYSLLNTASYTKVFVNKNYVEVQGLQTGKGVYRIQIRENKVLEILVTTTVLKKAEYQIWNI